MSAKRCSENARVDGGRLAGREKCVLRRERGGEEGACVVGWLMVGWWLVGGWLIGGEATAVGKVQTKIGLKRRRAYTKRKSGSKERQVGGREGWE